MVSANALTSEFILNDEIPDLIEKRKEEGMRLYPVIVEPCAWECVGWLKEYQVRPMDGEPLSEGERNHQEQKLTAIVKEIDDLIKRIPADGELKNLNFPDKIALRKLPTTTAKLFGREKELALLDEAWENPKTRIVSLVAFGGVGKTALVNAWLRRMREDHFRGAERIYGWSFYSQGASVDRQVSADAFLAETLRWFGDPEPDAGSPWQKGERLAELVKKQRTLLILDGMEPLQDLQQEGRVKDPGLQSLLKELAYDNPGLCVITTRHTIADLEEFTLSSACERSLELLSPEAGGRLLESLGVVGMDGDLIKASEEFGGHALALTLLGKYLKKKHRGEVHKRYGIPALTKDAKLGGHAKRVMESYEKTFAGEPELNVLRILGLFDRPAPKAAIDALTEGDVIPGLTGELHGLDRDDWNSALDTLLEFGVLNQTEIKDDAPLDCHPLIREHFGERLQDENPAAWKEAHSRLYEYYKDSAEELPKTIEEMEPLYAAVMHGCRAGRYQEALDEVYWERISRRDEFYGTKKLGAFGSDLAAVSCFFKKLWDRSAAELGEQDQAFLLNAAAFRLLALGRLREAAQPMKAGLDGYIKDYYWKESAIVACNLSELFLTVGDVEQAVNFARKSVKYADQSMNVNQRINTRSTLAFARYLSGSINEAKTGFREAEAMKKEHRPEYSLLSTLGGYQYCDFLLSQGNYAHVKTRTIQTIQWMIAQHWLLYIALDTLSLGRAEWMRILRERDGDFREAGEILDRAVDGLRKAGQQQYITCGLLARAELYRCTKDFERAHRDLREAMTIATLGEMRLHEADCHLQYGRLYLAEGEIGEAREHLEKVAGMIEEMGYGRRRPEVEVDFARLLIAEGKRDEARERLERGKELVEAMGYRCLDGEVRELEGMLGG